MWGRVNGAIVRGQVGQVQRRRYGRAMYTMSITILISIRLKLWCRIEFSYWIAADLTWKSIKPLDDREKRENQVTQTGTTANLGKGPHLPGHLYLENTLAKRLPEWVRLDPFKEYYNKRAGSHGRCISTKAVYHQNREG